jgi:tRNA A-37 threonylcarbamoyl transferase component Bud32
VGPQRDPSVTSATKREGAGAPAGTARFEPAVGTIVAGKYRVEGPLGEGGMGTVVLATHVGLDQRVAIKFLLPEALKNKDSVERFLREAKVAARVRSDHVARVHDVGTLEGGVPYIVMEYLEGSDLGGLIARHGSLPIEEACEISLQACEALAEVHAAGIVHRDLKPTNLFVTRRADGSPAVKLLDFGISKLAPGAEESGADPALTATTAIMGSPSYMSPEQLKSTKEVDPRTDVWSLGTVLYEAITGKPAFRGETLPQTCAMIAADDPVAPSALREGVPRELDQAILGCLRKNPDERERLVDLSRVLARLAPARARASLERIEATLGMSQPAASSQAAAEPQVRGGANEERAGGGRRGLLVLLVIAVAGVLGIGLTTGRINPSGLRREVSGATSAVTSAAGAVSSAIASAVASSLPDLPADETAPSSSGDLGEAPQATRPTASAPGVAPAQAATQPPTHGVPGVPAKPHPAKPHHATKPWRRGH